MEQWLTTGSATNWLKVVFALLLLCSLVQINLHLNIGLDSLTGRMFKSTLGLGLGSTKKADLTAYLRNLEKKNKEVQRKHSLTGGIEDVGNVEKEKEEEEKELDSQEDSDLLSLAREMQEEQYESPFIKRKTEQTTTTAAAGDGRVPEESEVEAH